MSDYNSLGLKMGQAWTLTRESMCAAARMVAVATVCDCRAGCARVLAELVFAALRAGWVSFGGRRHAATSVGPANLPTFSSLF